MAVTMIPTEFIYDIEQRRPMLGGQSFFGQTPGFGFLQGQFQGAGPYGQMPAAIDPTFSSGYEYAKSIAGGMPMEQVIAPGVSYSPDMPMGYTQAQLNTPVGTTPMVNDQTFKGDFIDSVTIPLESKINLPPVDRLGFLTGLPPVGQQNLPPVNILDKIGGLFNIPTNIPGRDFSIEQVPDFPMVTQQDLSLLGANTPVQDPIMMPPTPPISVPPISTPLKMPPPPNNNGIPNYLDDLNEKKEGFFFSSKYPENKITKQKFEQAKKDFNDARRYVTEENLDIYETEGLAGLESKKAKKAIKKYIDYTKSK